MTSSDIPDSVIRTYTNAASLPSSASIEALDEAASSLPPLGEAPDVAHSFARLMGMRANVTTFLQSVPWSVKILLVLPTATRGHGKPNRMTGRSSFAIDWAVILRLPSKSRLPYCYLPYIRGPRVMA